MISVRPLSIEHVALPPFWNRNCYFHEQFTVHRSPSRTSSNRFLENFVFREELSQKQCETRSIFCSRMHSLANRSNHLVSYTLTVMAIITGACALSTRFLRYERPARVVGRRVELHHIPNFTTDNALNDFAVVNFDVKVDLRGLFNWNVKQLFVYLTAEYATDDNVFNQVVVWDEIIERREDALLDLNDVASEYFFWDDGSGLRNRNVTLYVSWNVIPVAGALLDVASPLTNRFLFPSTYKHVVTK
ncbi:hypothetical protein GE061_004704 [Apolygus lucorum]|uniref:Signal peptidase complex subunit 3 n=1 Tax=Apolygus lucorum TaxID=248454 RepID=A0A8S9X2K5_APOLU|nr:hypothetical protein GE061_004704 [Apolygus lucorum]